MKASLSSPHYPPGNQAYPRHHWYVAAFSHEVGRHALARTLLDVPVVPYRTDNGTPILSYDRCPQRGLALSDGLLISDRIQRRYHGMEFSEQGACTNSPHQERVPSASNTMWMKGRQLIAQRISDGRDASTSLAEHNGIPHFESAAQKSGETA
jgi:phenylpropionate dioxygenase-like ring-hydroxylating dioxygenase large terminal subunit